MSRRRRHDRPLCCRHCCRSLDQLAAAMRPRLRPRCWSTAGRHVTTTSAASTTTARPRSGPATDCVRGDRVVIHGGVGVTIRDSVSSGKRYSGKVTFRKTSVNHTDKNFAGCCNRFNSIIFLIILHVARYLCNR